jgi:hypothetical protein
MIKEIIKNSSPVYPVWGLFMLTLFLILVDREKYKYLFMDY